MNSSQLQPRISAQVRELYEKYPYPPVGRFRSFFQGLRREGLETLNYRAACAASFGSTAAAVERPRILVAGCGSFEPVMVALANPGARIVGVDLSSSSLRLLSWQLRLRGLRRQVQLWRGDLHELPEELGVFDMVVATGVLHHLADPLAGLRSLLRRSTPDVVLRLMLYSRRGRSLLYATRELAGELGIASAGALRRLIRALPPSHPYRVFFELYSDARSDAGLLDGYFHPCDRAFTAEELLELLERAGLSADLFLHPPAGELAAFAPGDRLALAEQLGVLEGNFRLIAARREAPARHAPPAERRWEWNRALRRRGSQRSQLLGRALRWDRGQDPARLAPEARSDLEAALFLLRGGG